MSAPEVALESLSIGTERGKPMQPESVARDLEKMAAKVRAIGAPVQFSLKVRWS